MEKALNLVTAHCSALIGHTIVVFGGYQIINTEDEGSYSRPLNRGQIILIDLLTRQARWSLATINRLFSSNLNRQYFLGSSMASCQPPQHFSCISVPIARECYPVSNVLPRQRPDNLCHTHTQNVFMFGGYSTSEQHTGNYLASLEFSPTSSSSILPLVVNVLSGCDYDGNFSSYEEKLIDDFKCCPPSDVSSPSLFRMPVSLPSFRDKASMVFSRRRLVVFGGWTFPFRRQDCSQNQLEEISGLTNRCQEILSAASAAASSSMNQSETFFNEQEVNIDNEEASWPFLNQHGDFVGNWSASMLTGGGEYGWTNQLVVYDLETRRWSNPASSGCVPIPRAAHSACCCSDERRMFVFGGRVGVQGGQYPEFYYQEQQQQNDVTSDNTTSNWPYMLRTRDLFCLDLDGLRNRKTTKKGVGDAQDEEEASVTLQWTRINMDEFPYERSLLGRSWASLTFLSFSSTSSSTSLSWLSSKSCKLFVTGGFSSQNLPLSDAFVLEVSWEENNAISHHQHHPPIRLKSVTFVNDDATFSSSSNFGCGPYYIIDRTTLKLTPLPSSTNFNNSRVWHSAIKAPDGKVYAIGGGDSNIYMRERSQNMISANCVGEPPTLKQQCLWWISKSIHANDTQRKILRLSNFLPNNLIGELELLLFDVK